MCKLHYCDQWVPFCLEFDLAKGEHRQGAVGQEKDGWVFKSLGSSSKD